MSHAVAQPDLTRGTHLAITRAKRRGADHVEPDDLLVGFLQASARFGIVALGDLIIDLEELGESAPEDSDVPGRGGSYSDEAAAVFDEAARVAKREGSSRIQPAHMLAAFAGREDGLMGRIKKEYGVDGQTWRAALARWDLSRNGDDGSTRLTVKELLSPDEAAEFLGVHTQTIRGYIRSGKLAAHRLAGERAIRIRKEDLLNLLEPYEPE